MGPLISAEALLEKMQNEHVVLLDARGGADAPERFASSALRDAIRVDWESDLSRLPLDAANGGRHPLPPATWFGQRLTDWGITSETSVVVYDDKQGANAAARCWWMLRSIGHSNVAVLDGGLNAVCQHPLGETLLQTGASQRTVVDGSGNKDEASRKSDMTVDSPYHSEWTWPLSQLQEVTTAADDLGKVVIDVRESYRYRGESEPIDTVAGHIPGAINRPYTENLGPDGRFRSAEDLKHLYAQLFLDRASSDVIVHCGSGITACHTLLALEIAGLHGASLYVGSWSEWSRSGLPIAVGD